MSRIGIAIWNFEGEEPAAKIRNFAEMGYTAACVNNAMLDSLTKEHEAEINRVLQEHDLVITVHGGLVTVDADTALRRARRVVEWQERVGRIACSSYDVPHVSISEGVRRPDPEQIFDILRKVLEACAGAGMRVLLEDCPIFPTQVQVMSGWTEKYPDLGILVDLGHMNLRLREPRHDPQPLKQGAVEAYLRGIPWEICELHVHSNDGTRDQHAPPYAPNADLPEAARVLREIGFDGISTIELAPGWCGLPAEETMPACKRSLDYWRGLLDGK